MAEGLKYFIQQGVPDDVLNFANHEREAQRAAMSAQKIEDLGLFMGYVRKNRLVAISLGTALGMISGVINLMTEPMLTTGAAAFCTFPGAIFGVSYFLLKNRGRVNDHIYDWSRNWNDNRRTREQEIARQQGSWEFDGQTMWINSQRTDRFGRTVYQIGTSDGRIITTHKLSSCRVSTDSGFADPGGRH